MTSLYCEASIDPRSLSAAFHSVSFSSFIVEGTPSGFFFVDTAFLGGTVSVPSLVRCS